MGLVMCHHARRQGARLRVLVRPWILGTEVCSMVKSLRSFKPVFILFFEAYGALIFEAMGALFKRH